jgi:hypothetical protein
MSTVGKPDGMTLLPFTTTPSVSTWVKPLCFIQDTEQGE